MEDVLKRAIKKNGNIAQCDMAVEECGELIVEIQHFKRGRSSELKLAGEIADVRIMLKQLEIMYDLHDLVKMKEKEKIKRLEQRLNAKK